MTKASKAKATTATAKTAVVSSSAFVSKFVAIVDGADALTEAEEVQEHAASIISTQIQLRQSSKIQKKRAVQNAEKALEKALLNNGKIIDGADCEEVYVQNLVDAKKALEKAKKEFEKVDEDVDFLKGLLKEVEA